MADGDRLSSLPDDVLRRILRFATAKEGARTSVLARRWRFIWRSCGAVNLDSRSYDHLRRYRKRYEIMRDAREALSAAADGDLTKLTFRYEDDLLPWGTYGSASYDDDTELAKGDMAGELQRALLSPATRHVEELRLGLFYGLWHHRPTWLYELSIRVLSCSPSLRVLHISKCMDHLKPSAASMTPPFPRLADLRLDVCSVSLDILQAVIDAAPHLATLHLDGVQLQPQPVISNPAHASACSFHLRCPKVTSLVLENLHCWGHTSQNTMEVEAPLLRCFTYKGPVEKLSLKPSPPDLARVDLRFHVPAYLRTIDGTWQVFWELIRNLSGASNISLNFQ